MGALQYDKAASMPHGLAFPRPHLSLSTALPALAGELQHGKAIGRTLGPPCPGPGPGLPTASRSAVAKAKPRPTHSLVVCCGQGQAWACLTLACAALVDTLRHDEATGKPRALSWPGPLQRPSLQPPQLLQGAQRLSKARDSSSGLASCALASDLSMTLLEGYAAAVRRSAAKRGRGLETCWLAMAVLAAFLVVVVARV